MHSDHMHVPAHMVIGTESAWCFTPLAVFRNEFHALDAPHKVPIAAETNNHHYYMNSACIHFPSPICVQLASLCNTPHQCVADQQAGVPVSTGVMYAFVALWLCMHSAV
jgi:hypothetical protein